MKAINKKSKKDSTSLKESINHSVADLE